MSVGNQTQGKNFQIQTSRKFETEFGKNSFGCNSEVHIAMFVGVFVFYFLFFLSLLHTLLWKQIQWKKHIGTLHTLLLLNPSSVENKSVLNFTWRPWGVIHTWKPEPNCSVFRNQKVILLEILEMFYLETHVDYIWEPRWRIVPRNPHGILPRNRLVVHGNLLGILLGNPSEILLENLG